MGIPSTRGAILPTGKKNDLSLREKIRQIQRDLDDGIDTEGREMTVLELVKRYIATKTGVKPTTEAGYRTVVSILEKEAFAHQFEFGHNYIWYHDFLP